MQESRVGSKGEFLFRLKIKETTNPKHNMQNIRASYRKTITNLKTNILQPNYSLNQVKNAHALLSRMWWRNALLHSHQTLYLQKLRLVSHSTRTLGTQRQTPTKPRNSRRTTRKPQKRIPQMVVKQEKITKTQKRLTAITQQTV